MMPSTDDAVCSISSSAMTRPLMMLALVAASILLNQDVEAVHYVGNEAVWRENEDGVKRAIFLVDLTQRVVQHGHVVAWDVYTTRGRRSQVVHLQIWRPVRPKENRYQFVGETVIVALWIGHSQFTLYPRDRIRVRRGDVIGIYFPKYNPIPWSVAQCNHGNEHLYKYNPYGPTMVRDSVLQLMFEKAMTDWNPCRQYSVNATIMNDREIAQFDYDYEQTTDGRYVKRPYGPYLPVRYPDRYNVAMTTRMQTTSLMLVMLQLALV